MKYEEFCCIESIGDSWKYGSRKGSSCKIRIMRAPPSMILGMIADVAMAIEGEGDYRFDL